MLSRHTIFQSATWNHFQSHLPGRKAGTLKDIFWCVMPTLMGNRYLYLNRLAEISALTENWYELVQLAKKMHCLYIKLEPAWSNNEQHRKELEKMGFQTSHFHIQPDTTLYLDLTKSNEELLKEMKPKGRYNIKIAAKHGIHYQAFDKKSPDLESALQQFYNILETTAKRDGFSIHQYSYYLTFLRELFPHCKLYLAYYQDQVVAGLIVTFYNKQAIYYYGASDSQHRHTMATYGLQWHVIQEVRSWGAESYDFLGIAPTDSDKKHPWYGVTDFKRKFGGEVYSYSGTFHYPLQAFKYFFLHTLKQIYYEAKKLIQRNR